MSNTSDLFAQVLESARKELEYVEHRLATPRVARFTVIRESDVGGMTVARIIEAGKDFTKFNFAGDASTAANLETRAQADRLLAMALENRSDFDKETATYRVCLLSEYLRRRADQLRDMIEATRGLA